MDELETLKAQHKLLQQKLEQQQIVTEKQIRRATSKRIRSLRRQLSLELGIGFFAIPYCTCAFYSFGCSLAFCIATLLFLMGCVIYQYFTRQCYAEAASGEVPITEMIRRTAMAKLRTARQFRVGMFILVPWFVWACIELMYCRNVTVQAQRIGMVVGACIGCMVGLMIGYRLYKRHQNMATELISQLKELESYQ